MLRRMLPDLAMGLGAVVGGLYSAGQSNIREFQPILTAIAFWLSILLLAVMPNLVTSFIVMTLALCLSLFISLGNTTLQFTSDQSIVERHVIMVNRLSGNHAYRWSRYWSHR